jgi:hypothetical protein
MKRSAASRRAVLLTALSCSFAAPALADIVVLRADLRGENEVPAVTTGARGSAEVRVDLTSRQVSWVVDYEGLTTPLSAAHLHGPAATNANAGILVPFQPQATRQGKIVGKATITEQQVNDMLAGRWYVNLHTPSFPSGEIRGQLFKR